MSIIFFKIIYVIFVHNSSYQVDFTYKVYISRSRCLEFDLPWYSFIISRVDRYNADKCPTAGPGLIEHSMVTGRLFSIRIADSQ